MQIIYRQLYGFMFYYLVGKIRGSLNKFPYFFRMGSFIGSTQMNL